MAGRPSPMDDPEVRQQFAEAYASGAKREELADIFDVTKETISRWTRRPEVQAIITEVRQTRVNRILRKVDSAIESRLNDDGVLQKMDLKELLAVRKEFTPQRVEVGRAGDFDGDAAALGAWDQLDKGHEPEALPEPEQVVDAEVVDDETE